MQGVKTHVVLPVQDNVPLITDARIIYKSASLAMPAIGADLFEDDEPLIAIPKPIDTAALHASTISNSAPVARAPAQEQTQAQAQAQTLDDAKQRNRANHNITHFPT